MARPPARPVAAGDIAYADTFKSLAGSAIKALLLLLLGGLVLARGQNPWLAAGLLLFAAWQLAMVWHHRRAGRVPTLILQPGGLSFPNGDTPVPYADITEIRSASAFAQNALVLDLAPEAAAPRLHASRWTSLLQTTEAVLVEKDGVRSIQYRMGGLRAFRGPLVPVRILHEQVAQRVAASRGDD